jgi:hypothetical protein
MRSNSPDGRHSIERRSGGELGMGGPEWDYVSIAGGPELRCFSSEVVWSDDSEFVALIEWHIDDAPNRKGAEGMTSRVVVVRLRDGVRRHFLGNRGMARMELLEFSGGTLSLLVNGKPTELSIAKASW